MDFSWVVELAEQANRKQEERIVKEREQKLEEKQLALATGPFVEKLNLLINTCAEEFNKHIRYPRLKIATTRIQKRTKGSANQGDPELTYPEEVAYFTFSRQDWTYGIRGARGVVDFIEVPSNGTSGGFSVSIEETAINPSHKLIAKIDDASQQIIWTHEGEIVKGEDIVALCKEYVRQFIERTNP